MMYVVVYLSAKIGQVYGKGLFACIRDQYPRAVLLPTVTLACAGNVIEAAADLGGIGPALNLTVPLSIPLLVLEAPAIIYTPQSFETYYLLRSVFRWLAPVLFSFFG